MHGVTASQVLARFLAQSAKKPKVEPPSSDAADQAARESEARGKDLKKALSDVNDLGKKLDGKGGAKHQKAFDKAYDHIHELGEKAAASAEKLLKEYGDTLAQGSRGEDKRQRESAIHMLETTLRSWGSHEVEHFKPKDTHGKLQQAEQTFGYAVELETYIRQVGKSLKGEYRVDDGWWR